MEETGFEPVNSLETGSPIFLILSPAFPKAVAPTLARLDYSSICDESYDR